MNSKQNERIIQVQENTVIIGIDIASETHYASAIYWSDNDLNH